MSGCCGPAAVELEPSRQAVRPDELPVVVIGAGPVGLAAAAHLAERDLDFVVLEAGERAGASVAKWGHVRVFSPWRYNIDAAATQPRTWPVPVSQATYRRCGSLAAVKPARSGATVSKLAWPVSSPAW
jgi:glycine/D-amino acid oxidase-like deaminating enzyme